MTNTRHQRRPGAGRPWWARVRLDILKRVADLSAGDFLPAVDTLVRTGVLVVAPDSGEAGTVMNDDEHRRRLVRRRRQERLTAVSA